MSGDDGTRVQRAKAFDRLKRLRDDNPGRPITAADFSRALRRATVETREESP